MTVQARQQVDVEIYGPSFSSFVRTVMLICQQYNISYRTGFELDEQPVEFKSEQHFALHPYGKLPILKHNELILPETATICRYLINRFAPQVHQQQALALQAKIDAFSALAALYIDKAIIRDYVLEFAFPKGENGEVRLDVAKAAQPAVIDALNVIEHELNHGESLNGEQLTIADAMIAPQLHYLSTLPGDFNLLTQSSVVAGYLEQLMSRDICQKVLIAKK